MLNGALFKTTNSNSTTISTFDDGIANREISVLCGDSHTVFSAVSLRLVAPMTCTSGNLIRFIFDGTIWSETARTFVTS